MILKTVMPVNCGKCQEELLLNVEEAEKIIALLGYAATRCPVKTCRAVIMATREQINAWREKYKVPTCASSFS